MQIHQTYLVGKLNIYNPVFQQKLYFPRCPAHSIMSVRKSVATFLRFYNKNLSKAKNQPYCKVAEIQLYLIKRKIPWMRLITSLAINEFRECLFDLRSANQIGTQLHSWLARSERNWLISSLSQANKKTGISPVFLFTLDAIRTHDLPLRSCIRLIGHRFSGFIRIYLYLLQHMNLKQILFSDFVNFSINLSELLQLICNCNVIKERLNFEKL